MSDAFDLIVGSSAGAINGMALLSGVAQRASDAYCGPLASKSFVNPLRVLRGKPVIDVNDVLTVIAGSDVAGNRTTALRRDRAALHRHRRGLGEGRRPDRDARAGGGVDRDPRLQPDAVGGRAASRDRRAPVPRRRYDLPVPVAEAIAVGAAHVLALQTRPFGIPRKSASRIGDRLIERHLRGLNPALVTVYRERIGQYEPLVDELGT